jgi:1-acyl-sn-glycerol-3-phosphate acyltransferase
LIFPEGTRKSSKPKAGIAILAYNTQAKVIPVNIKNSNKFSFNLLKKTLFFISSL